MRNHGHAQHKPIAIFHSLSPPSLSLSRETKDDTMSAARFFGDDHAPGINFTPDDEELIELYLLPRVLGEPDPFPGLIIDDDEAATTQLTKNACEDLKSAIV
jgi:hypothetical protein